MEFLKKPYILTPLRWIGIVSQRGYFLVLLLGMAYGEYRHEGVNTAVLWTLAVIGMLIVMRIVFSWMDKAPSWKGDTHP